MFKHAFEGVDIFNPIKGKEDKIIDYFVSFYGEKYRERIASRIKNTTFIFADKLYNSRMQYEVKNYFENTILKLKNDFISQNNLAPFALKYDLGTIPSLIEKVENFVGGGRIDKGLETFLTCVMKTDEKTVANNLQNKYTRLFYIKKLKRLEGLYEEYVKNAQYLSREEARLLAPIEEFLQKREETCRKYHNLSINEVKTYLAGLFGRDKGNIEDEFAEEFYMFTQGYFQNPQKHLNMLRYLTLSTDIDIEKYLDTDDIEPSIERLIRDNNLREKFVDPALDAKLRDFAIEERQEIIAASPAYQALTKSIAKNDLFNPNSDFLLGEFMSNESSLIAYVDHTFKKSDPQNPYSICVFPDIFTLDNASVVHELTHIIQTDITINNAWEFQTKCGISEVIYDKNINMAYGSFSLNSLNEVLTDYLALKVERLMQNDGFSIGLHPFELSAFADAFPLLQNFIEDNMEDIKECVMSDDLALLYKKFGEREVGMLASATGHLLSLPAAKYVGEEIKQKLGRDADIFSILDNIEIDWSATTSEYINCYRTVDYVVNKIRLQKLKNRENVGKNKPPFKRESATEKNTTNVDNSNEI